MTAKFGPSGNSDSFYNQGYKSSIDAPEWIKSLGLDCYEYSCTRGVRVGEKTAKQIGQKAEQNDILMSIHAPYYINFASTDVNSINKSKKYIKDCINAAKWLKADRIVFHPGSCAKIDRSKAFQNTKKSIKELLDEIKEDCCKYNIKLCPETMGKRNQLGTVEEIIDICSIDEILLPVLDFGHIYAFNLGKIKSKADYDCIFNEIKNKLGTERLNKIHCHFSRIEYTKAGEKKHWTLNDVDYGPDFEPIAESIVHNKINPRIICESRGTMADDAVKIKKIYLKYLNKYS
ncbi:MAG: TIM barrel protein [Clostridia bacterium]|nr:TIM barrel protein [Clostridia bacterium]